MDDDDVREPSVTRTYRMPRDTLRQLDELADAYHGGNRSEALRVAVQSYWYGRRPDHGGDHAAPSPR